MALLRKVGKEYHSRDVLGLFCVAPPPHYAQNRRVMGTPVPGLYLWDAGTPRFTLGYPESPRYAGLRLLPRMRRWQMETSTPRGELQLRRSVPKWETASFAFGGHYSHSSASEAVQSRPNGTTSRYGLPRPRNGILVLRLIANKWLAVVAYKCRFGNALFSAL